MSGANQQELISYVKKYKNIFGIDYDPIFSENEGIFHEIISPPIVVNGLPAESALSLTLKWMKEGLSKYIAELKKNNKQAQHDTDAFINYFEKIFQAFNLPSDKITSKEKLSEYILGKIRCKNPVIIPSAYKGHSITFAIYKNKLICVNRGRFILNNTERDSSWGSVKNTTVKKDADQEYGLWWTEINPNILDNTENMRKLIKHLLKCINFSGSTQSIKPEEKEFMDKLMNLLNTSASPSVRSNVRQIEGRAPPKVTINTLQEHPVAKQKFRNCTWANKKPIILALLLFLCREDNPGISLDTILQEYKKCTTFLRVQEIDNLIKDALDENKPNIQLAAKKMLLAIIIKLTSKLSANVGANSRDYELLDKIIKKLSEYKLYTEIFKQLPTYIQDQLTILQLKNDDPGKASLVEANKESTLIELLLQTISENPSVQSAIGGDTLNPKSTSAGPSGSTRVPAVRRLRNEVKAVREGSLPLQRQRR